jgi:hypothetical protein
MSNDWENADREMDRRHATVCHQVGDRFCVA